MALPLNHKPNTLSLHLLDRGSPFTFHWTLYLTSSPPHGQTFHLINAPGSDLWTFDSQPTEDITHGGRLLVALELGEIEPALHAAMAERLAQVSVGYSTNFREAMTCRIWVKEALFALEEEGYLCLPVGGVQGVDGIEEEARGWAMRNRVAGRFGVKVLGGV
ncbi:hypothetical protein ASPACDRAFT_47967 [Aspergillus aculeatus ATCC 16872]|uniref:Uncharacterized protein n=1 Tax=Aspergillus aculeatus (strain ATCC 16872 / CBS 172.66 / WB 5094) TaxID=690307 RepID=A0A1L9WGB8_ASPA1|nr:uncharacterized protein ASPACDRAFT_47967 [Aspergillus aculeatus ATCC 16872]OJJ95221.1 hypothetical protein ASPACDRAFT_47967 [Aspergillus aculeatus ATCC 16872]